MVPPDGLLCSYIVILWFQFKLNLMDFFCYTMMVAQGIVLAAYVCCEKE